MVPANGDGPPSAGEPAMMEFEEADGCIGIEVGMADVVAIIWAEILPVEVEVDEECKESKLVRCTGETADGPPGLEVTEVVEEAMTLCPPLLSSEREVLGRGEGRGSSEGEGISGMDMLGDMGLGCTMVRLYMSPTLGVHLAVRMARLSNNRSRFQAPLSTQSTHTCVAIVKAV